MSQCYNAVPVIHCGAVLPMISEQVMASLMLQWHVRDILDFTAPQKICVLLLAQIAKALELIWDPFVFQMPSLGYFCVFRCFYFSVVKPPNWGGGQRLDWQFVVGQKITTQKNTCRAMGVGADSWEAITASMTKPYKQRDIVTALVSYASGDGNLSGRFAVCTHVCNNTKAFLHIWNRFVAMQFVARVC